MFDWIKFVLAANSRSEWAGGELEKRTGYTSLTRVLDWHDTVLDGWDYRLGKKELAKKGLGVIHETETTLSIHCTQAIFEASMELRPWTSFTLSSEWSAPRYFAFSHHADLTAFYLAGVGYLEEINREPFT